MRHAISLLTCLPRAHGPGIFRRMSDTNVNEPSGPGRIAIAELERRIGAGEVDSVISGITDLQGHLMGKRMTGDYFREHARPRRL